MTALVTSGNRPVAMPNRKDIAAIPVQRMLMAIQKVPPEMQDILQNFEEFLIESSNVNSFLNVLGKVDRL